MDFSGLTNEQLLELLKGAMAEAIARGGAVKAAAQGEVLSAQERAAIEFAVAEKLRIEKEEKERERIAKETEARFKKEEIEKAVQKTASTWEIKAAAIAAIREWGYEGKFEINIWSRGADRRVYFQDSKYRESWKWCLYLTGNEYHPPGDFEGEGVKCWFDNKKEPLAELLAAIAKTWKSDISIPDSAANVEPSEKHLQMYLSAIALKEKIDA